jgi:ABC-type protease/lipase transport system fused ATPase/permease subunit
VAVGFGAYLALRRSMLAGIVVAEALLIAGMMLF